MDQLNMCGKGNVEAQHLATCYRWWLRYSNAVVDVDTFPSSLALMVSRCSMINATYGQRGFMPVYRASMSGKPGWDLQLHVWTLGNLKVLWS